MTDFFEVLNKVILNFLFKFNLPKAIHLFSSAYPVQERGGIPSHNSNRSPSHYYLLNFKLYLFTFLDVALSALI